MKKLTLLLLAICLIPLASANVIITEIMFYPTQTQSQTDAEWIELYNNGERLIDLSDWKINNFNFDDYIIQPKEYVVVARKLVDGSNDINQSFESYWGNNDGIWDEKDGINAINGFFRLANSEGTVNLTNGSVSDFVYYNTSISKGEGKSIILSNYSLPNRFDNWIEGIYGGTPGRGENENFGGNIYVEANILNVPSTIEQVIFGVDDSIKPGLQIMPNGLTNRTIEISIIISNKNGPDNIKKAGVRINEREYCFDLIKDENGNLTFNGTFEILTSDPAQKYNLEAFVKEQEIEITETIEFEYMGLISSVIETDDLIFNNLIPGKISEEISIDIKNKGNTNFDIKIQAFDLTSSEQVIERKNLEVFIDDWQSLNINRLLGNLSPNKIKPFKFRLNVPSNIKEDKLTGNIRIISMGA